MPLGPSIDFMPARRSGTAAAIVVAHVALVWVLLQSSAVRQGVTSIAPLMVSIVAAQTMGPTAAHPTPERNDSPSKPQPKTAPAPRQRIEVRDPVPTSVPSPPVSAQPSLNAPVAEPSPEPSSSQASPASTTDTAEAPATAATSGATTMRMIPPSAVQYLIPPQLEYPRVSRRLRETGHAVVRVLIDEHGLPSRMLIERSSGFALLDEAALNAVRKARFKPHTEEGRPVAGWALIPLSFDLES